MSVQPGQELSSIDFASMIGGPLLAVIQAQAQSAMTSVSFIKSVGFQKVTSTVGGQQVTKEEPVYVTFEYDKTIANPKAGQKVTDANGNETGAIEPDTIVARHALKVPILTMLPVPFIRVEETTIDFHAKIVATEFSRTDTDLKVGTQLEAKAGWGPFSAKLKANFSYQKKSSSGEDVKRTYSLVIHVRAVQDEMPAGTERLLSILENQIAEAPQES